LGFIIIHVKAEIQPTANDLTASDKVLATPQAGGGASASFAQETANAHSGTSCQRIVAGGLNAAHVPLLYHLLLTPGALGP